MIFVRNFIEILLTVLQLAIFIRIILSWIPTIDRSSPLVELLYQITEPILAPARRIIPPIAMMDISPMVVLIGLQLLQQII